MSKYIDAEKLKITLDSCIIPDWVKVLVNRVIDDMTAEDGRWKIMGVELPTQNSKIVVYNYEHDWFDGGIVRDDCIVTGEGEDFSLNIYDIWRYIDIPNRGELYDE